MSFPCLQRGDLQVTSYFHFSRAIREYAQEFAVDGDFQFQTGSSKSLRATKILRATLFAFGLSPPSPPHLNRRQGGVPARCKTKIACLEFNGEGRLCDGAGDPQASRVVGHSRPYSDADGRLPDNVNSRAWALRKGTTSWNFPLAVNLGSSSLSRTVTSSKPLSRNTRFTDSMTS